MNIENLGRKLEELGNELSLSEKGVNEGFTPLDQKKIDLTSPERPVTGINPDGTDKSLDSRIAPCSKLDILAARSEVTDKRTVLSPDSCPNLDYYAERHEMIAEVESRIDACSKLDVLAEQPATAMESRIDACSKLDVLAEQPVTAMESRIDACSKLDVLAEQPEAAALDRDEQAWLDQQPEGQSISFKGLNPTCICGSINCTGCSGALMGSHIECRGGSCLPGKKHPKCPSGKRPYP